MRWVYEKLGDRKGAAACLLVIILLFSWVIRHLTGNDTLASILCLVLIVALMILYVTNSGALEGLLPNVMEKLSLFERFYVFVNGMFDLTGVVYYLTVAAFFLFLSVQSLEKRRYN